MVPLDDSGRLSRSRSDLRERRIVVLEALSGAGIGLAFASTANAIIDVVTATRTSEQDAHSG
jgi:hypothetical protein